MKRSDLYQTKLPLIAFLVFWMALGLWLVKPVFAKECLTTLQQLKERRLSHRWKELNQKDSQPLSLTISEGRGDQLHFIGKKPDGSTWISGAMSICPSTPNEYRVKLERIDKAPFLVAQHLVGKSDTIKRGSPRLKFGSGRNCGNPDRCIEFAAF